MLDGLYLTSAMRIAEALECDLAVELRRR